MRYTDCMRLAPFSTFGLRQPGLDRVVLTERERDTLRRAAAILDEVRTRRNARVPVDWYAGDEDDADLVFGWRICDELARKGSIDAESIAREYEKLRTPEGEG